MTTRLDALESTATRQLADLAQRVADFLARRSEWTVDERERGARVDELLELARARQREAQHAST